MPENDVRFWRVWIWGRVSFTRDSIFTFQQTHALYVAALSEESGETTSNIQNFVTDGQLHRRDQPKPSLFQGTGHKNSYTSFASLYGSPHPGKTSRSASTDLEKAETLNCFFIKQS